MSSSVIIRHRFLDTNDIRMHVADAGRGYPIVLLHGFPELWYSWRKQLFGLAESGFRVLAPDLRGYGGTDAPEDVDSYQMHVLVEDVVGLLDDAGFDKVAVVGHDWGGLLAWHVALRHPERVERVVSLTTPFFTPGPTPPTTVLRDYYRLDDRTFYMRRFLEPGVAEAELEADVRQTFTKLMRPAKHADDFWTFATVGGDGSSLIGKIGSGDTLLSKIDLETYARVFKRTGFRGGLLWYRAADASWEEEKTLPSFKIEAPAMLIMAKEDRILRPELAEGTRACVPDLRIEILPDCGHWIQQEKPGEVNALLVDFLGDLRETIIE
jgi:pimeloyl-ACP methyl ester carboxylesterase